MKLLTREDEVDFRKYWKSAKKDVLIAQMWEMFQLIERQNIENEELRDRLSRAQADCLSRCRSVGGITLPPGV